MAGDSNPLDTPQIKLSRDRIVSELLRVRDIKNATPLPQEVESSFNRAASLSNKANHLANSLSESASSLYIPVHPSAVNVINAVKRKSGDSVDGLKISFDLFADAVEAMQRLKVELKTLIVVSSRNDPDQVLAKRVRKLRARINLNLKSDDVDDNYIEMLISQFVILYLAHELMKPFEGILDHMPLSETWVEKQSGGSDTQILISVLIGLALQFIIMGLNDELMEDFLIRAGAVNLPGGLTAKGIIAEARKVEPTTAMGIAADQAALNDYETILRYSFQYIQKNYEKGFDIWIAYVDTVQIRNVAQSLWIDAPHYSVSHALSSQSFSHSKKRKRRSSQKDSDRNQLDFEEIIKNSLVPMSRQNYEIREGILEKIDQDLDLVAQVYSSEFAREIACCLAATLKELPVDTLRAVRGFLRAALKSLTFDINFMLNSIIGDLTSPNLEDILALEINRQIDRVFNKLVIKVLGLMGDNWKPLLCCPFLREIIEVILKQIRSLEAELKGAVNIMTDKLVFGASLGSLSIQKRTEIAYEAKILRKMIKIIDAVLDLSTDIHECGQEWLSSSKLETALTELDIPHIAINENIKDNYFTSALGRELTSGKFIPKLGDKIETLIIDPIQDSIEDLKGKHSCVEVSSDTIFKSTKTLNGNT